jgi:tRNA (guanine37-N1)-methyltransferase
VRIDIVTIFPGFFDSPLREGIISRSREKGLLDIRVHDLRGYTTDRHRVTDDYPYGGGAGMVMKPEPIFAAVESIREEGPPRTVVLLTPKGKLWSQGLAEEFSAGPGLILICGRYEGEDERVRTNLVDEEISIGDYVLNGGEAASLVLLESVARLVPGVVGAAESVERDSFTSGLLDYPHYTRPPVFRGMEVPKVLLSGNHADIDRWRRKESLRITRERRPGLLEALEVSAEDRELLEELSREDGER